MQAAAGGGDEIRSWSPSTNWKRSCTSMKREFRSSTECEQGQTMAEYAVVLGVITLAIVTALAALSGGVSAAVSAITGRI
jgi:Flp pilus assembly pilin Flp